MCFSLSRLASSLVSSLFCSYLHSHVDETLWVCSFSCYQETQSQSKLLDHLAFAIFPLLLPKCSVSLRCLNILQQAWLYISLVICDADHPFINPRCINMFPLDKCSFRFFVLFFVSWVVFSASELFEFLIYIR